MYSRNPIDLAQRYFVNDLPSSTIPASRLRTLLEKLQENQPLTTIGFNYLQQLAHLCHKALQTPIKSIA